MKHLTIALAVVLVLGVGCRKQTPVNEVSLSQSGVEIVAKDLSSLAGQWPQWRGPKGDGIAPDQPLSVRWSEQESVRWIVDIPGRGHSSPTVVNGLVVVGSADDNRQEQMVIAFDCDTGEQQWKTTVHQGNFPGSREVHQKATNANSTVATDGEYLITSHLNRERIFVTALDLNGNQIWQTDIGAFGSKFGYAPSPVLYQSLVIVAADNFGGGYLVGIDRQSGEIAWRRARGNASSYSSPHVANVGGVEQLLISGGDRLASYNPATGEPLWETQCISESTCGTVVTSDDHIFASGGYPDKETVCLTADGTRVWSDRTDLYEPSPILFDGHLFGVTDKGIAMCWQAADGKVAWKKRLGSNFSSSPVICNGHLYIADLSGNCYVIEASGDEFRQVAKNHLGNDCYASPAIANGAIYMRVGFGTGEDRQEKLICIGES